MEKASIQNNWHYNPKLKDRAKYLRKHFTKAESYLWKFGLKGNIMGYAFKRQRPVLNYIADFMCCELNLIIECDGATHLLPGAKERDLKRQCELEAVGFTVLRFEDSMVLNHLTTALGIIQQETEHLAEESK
jgi:very-short-patch-repair endonuclease